MSDGHAAVPPWLEHLRPSHTSDEEYTEVFRVFCETDWASKDPSLGPLNQWPYSLRMIVQLIFTSTAPQCVSWGPTMVILYNTAYCRLTGWNKHPEMMGAPAKEAFAGMTGKDWDPYPHMQRARETRARVSVPETLYLRKGQTGSGLEETYMSYTVSVLYGDDCSLAGTLTVYTETTESRLHARRGQTLRSLVTATHELTTLTVLRHKLQSAFGNCASDFPMCMIMLTDKFLAGEQSALSSSEHQIEYQTFIQVGLTSQFSSRTVRYDYLMDENQLPMFGPLAQKAHLARGPIYFETERLELQCAKRALNYPCKNGRMSPIYAKTTEASGDQVDIKPFGYLLLTFSPVRPIDEYISDYANTVDNLISTAFQNFQDGMRSRAQNDEVAAVRKVGEKYFKVLNNSPAGISVQNWKTQEILFASDQWRVILGYTSSQSLDAWADLVYPDDVDYVYDILATIQPGDILEEKSLRLRRLHTNRKPAWISVNCSFHVELVDGQLLTILTMAIHDTSAQVYAKELELATVLERERLNDARELERQRADEAHRAQARQTEYIDTLAHEIRNPVSAVVQTVEILLQRLSSVGVTNTQQAAELQQSIDDLETIDICTTHMSRVINDTLNVSKLEHGSLAISLETCDLLKHVQSIHRMLQRDMANKGIDCKGVEIDHLAIRSFSCAIADPLRYKQIVLNLMTNAIKFTALQTGAKHISLKLTVEKGKKSSSKRILVCSIRDTGRGMSQEAIRKLFGKFYQGAERTHVEYGGSGLGLFISQRLASLLGGSIEVTSEIDQGSTFVFRMPAEIASADKRRSCNVDKLVLENEATQELHLSIEDLVDKHALPSPAIDRPPRIINRPDLSEPRVRSSLADSTTPPDSAVLASDPMAAPENSVHTILVIEDNLINQKLMVKQLRKSGYHVLVGNHGLEALEHFKQGASIDLVLTDIEMPVMNGIETIAAVRALQDKIIQPPFIACSAYAREEQRQAFIAAGMADVIAKPFKYADLKTRVEYVLSQRPALLRRRENTI